MLHTASRNIIPEIQRLPGIGKPDSVALVVAIIAIVAFTIPVAIIAYIGVKRQLKINRIKKASG